MKTIRSAALAFLAALPLAAAASYNTNCNPAFTGEFTGEAKAPGEPLALWYRRPARVWTEALPIGNGHLGAMVFGGIERERIQLNEGTLWAGGPYVPDNTNAFRALPEVRRLIFAGKFKEAEGLIQTNILSTPPRQMQFQPVGDLLLQFPEPQAVADYRRELNLDTAVARTSYRVDHVTYTREIFASAADNIIVMHISADAPGKISFTATVQTPQDGEVTVENRDTLVLRGVNGGAQGIKGALRFQARVRVTAHGGKLAGGDGAIQVSGANEATLYIAAATSYRSYRDVTGNPEAVTKVRIANSSNKPFSHLIYEHLPQHQLLFRRVNLDLGKSDAMRLPTDERIKNFRDGDDPQLAALYFQFGRYLLMSCSRPGGQPANLQGIWNESMNPPWGSKFTININTEMNYWLAEPANLGECVTPLATMIHDMSLTGAHTAKTIYGAHGWVAHHNTDLWRATGPIDAAKYGMWPMGGAWLCEHLWEHYLFTGDERFLANNYPAMKGAAEFFLDALVEDPVHHWLVTAPSISPEHSHPFGTSICAGPTMDMQILRDLFADCILAAQVLGKDEAFRARLTAVRAQLAPNQIGKAGQLQEWMDDWDMNAPDIHHRHVSQLYGFFPGHDITLRGTPELAAAVKKSLEIRGDKATGWATAWRINLWARLHEGDHAFEILKFLLGPDRTYPDMFDAHPPFQIDGNFGGAAGIAEMLLQSQGGEIELLPALPKAWPNGSVTGLRARGGFEVDMTWRDGSLMSATIRSITGTNARLRCGNAMREVKLQPGATFTWLGN